MHAWLLHMSSAWVSGKGGSLQFGNEWVLLRKPAAKLGVVPLCHSQERGPKYPPKALRRPVTGSLSFFATPRQMTKGFFTQSLVLGKSPLQIVQFFTPLRMQDFNGTNPCFVRLCMWCCTRLNTRCTSARYCFLNLAPSRARAACSLSVTALVTLLVRSCASPSSTR